MKHFTDIHDCSREELTAILDLADEVVANPGKLSNRLRDMLLVNLFYEASTRTRVSFEVAAKRLGMHVVNISAVGSSVEKGESLEDTFQTIQAMSPDCLAIRHPDPGTARKLAALSDEGVHIINAGDGIASHPTQALLDALMLRQKFESLGHVRLVMAGDIRHSRVARSNIRLLSLLGIGEIRLCGPAGFVPPAEEFSEERAPITRFESLDRAVAGANAIMMLRIQKERISNIDIPDAVDYHEKWGLRQEHLELAAPGCWVLHPGPMNRGVEIASEVADGPRSLIRAQVRNGVSVRMALLYQLLS